MSPDNIIRTWKDNDYWKSLSADERAACPQNPAGMIELSDEELGDVGGGTTVTLDACCATIAISIGVSQLLECKDSILHGTCGAWTIGCCTPHES